MYAVEKYAAVRQFVFVEGKSRREAARFFGLSRDTIARMCRYSAPPGYVRTKPPRKPKLGPLLPVIDAILEADKSAPPKQRHTALRIFERLKAEHGYTGGYTAVKDYVRTAKGRLRETFVPLVHPPGHAQVDFGEAIGVIGGVRQKLHVFFMDLPHSDVPFIKAYPAETTEAFLDGRVSAFGFFGEVPQSILYDNTKLAVVKICGDGTRNQTQAFTGLISHYLFRPLRPAGQGQRQRQDRRVGEERPPPLPDAGAAGRELRRAECQAGSSLPRRVGPPRRPAHPDHWRARDGRPGRVPCTARRPLRCVREAHGARVVDASGALSHERLLGADGLRLPLLCFREPHPRTARRIAQRPQASCPRRRRRRTQCHRQVLQSGTSILYALSTIDMQISKEHTVARSQSIANDWRSLPGSLHRSLVRRLVQRIVVHADHVDIEINRHQLHAVLSDPELREPVAPHCDPQNVDGYVIKVDASLRRAGQGLRMVVHDAPAAKAPSAALVNLIVKAFEVRDKILNGNGESIEAASERIKVNANYITALLRISFLAPDIVEAILDGRQPVTLTARNVSTKTHLLPRAWSLQRRHLGF